MKRAAPARGSLKALMAFTSLNAYETQYISNKTVAKYLHDFEFLNFKFLTKKATGRGHCRTRGDSMMTQRS